jgi:protein-disulfide isomerase-like protein with CxxC motif
MGTQVNDEQGWPCLLLEDGTRLRAYEDAIYFPATQAWYQKANK